MIETLAFAAPKAPASTAQPLLGAIALTGAVFVVCVLVVWLALRRIAKFRKISDDAFVPLGFAASGHFRGKKYDGTIHGRPVHAWALPPKRYVGSLFGLTMGAAVRGRLRFGPRVGPDFIRKLAGVVEVPLGPGDEDRIGTADRPELLAALLADPHAGAAIRRVARGGGTPVFVEISDGAVRLHATGYVYGVLLVGPGAVRALLDDCAAVASAAERLGV